MAKQLKTPKPRSEGAGCKKACCMDTEDRANTIYSMLTTGKGVLFYAAVFLGSSDVIKSYSGSTSPVTCSYAAQTQPTELPRTDPGTLPKEEHPDQSRALFCRSQGAPGPANSGSPCSSDGTSQPPSEPETWPPQYLLGVGAENGLFQPNVTLAPKILKWTPQLGGMRAGSKQQTLCPSSRNVLSAYRRYKGGFLRFPGILAPRDRHVGSGCLNWQNWLFWAANPGGKS